MAGRLASVSSASPPSVSIFGSAAFGAASPPQQSFALTKPMSADVLTNTMSSHSFGLSPIGERRPTESSASSLLSKLEPTTTAHQDMENLPAILMRKLPRNTTLDVLRTMLLFAKDMVDVSFVDPEYPEDASYSSAVARFLTLNGAKDAKDKLNGKAISNDAKLLVELFQSGIAFPSARRNTVDGTTLRHASSSASSTGSSGAGLSTGRQSSRFNGTFQSLEKMSPPNGSLGSDKFPAPESKASIQSLFSPQSPLANATVSSKSMINDDPTDETGKLLNDPVAYARSGESAHMPGSRRPTNPEIPTSRFAGLSLLSTAPGGVQSPQTNGYVSPRPGHSMQSPSSAFSAGGMNPMTNLSPSTGFPMAPPFHQRHPPPNPADQNPPCNTLYVGNLPVDTSEDELKSVFSKQRGYKRLCFRTKQNGPMCFVEFEDVSFATKALHELYGHPLHNSVKGGIRLSFSKNPLGVRSGQQTSGLQASSMGPPPGMQGMNGGPIGAPPGFSTATGPPPGLPNPNPAASPLASVNGNTNYGLYGAAGGFGMSNGAYGPSMRQPMPMPSTMTGNPFQGMNNDYISFMGR
ncbi:uncharacterized protein PV09_04416 [Verruconis gallopava]|uniref:RRM domain-containing protein n=1 Tax=Verruconis gallopava TaxID=253628 RepID=A0A0D2ADY4_9PEZI|nr:uncharacterized protein PV09_04416 [Verruconis gallopava]KIW04680.1 hypothetical protein PV09_04416 [Verruconis gallopava]